MGLKTTYYLRTLAASQIEKSSLDAGKFGFTQKRQQEPATTLANGAADVVAAAMVEAASYVGPGGIAGEVVVSPPIVAEPLTVTAIEEPQPKLCRIDDPECEACQ
jgi:ribonucleoside-diphosphate reductase alpha chain